MKIHPEVDHALRRRRPVVALETAVATAGLPAKPLGRAPACVAPGWKPGGGCALETLRLMQRIVRAGGAVPASIGVVNGTFRIGMDETDLGRLVEAGAGVKASARDLAAVMAAGGTAGATVSATLVGCRAPGVNVRVLATGGIGGMHRWWARRLDVSADLAELARTPVCVVASGVKSVLDVPATLEALEALGIPVVAFNTDLMPQFYCRGRKELPAPHRADDLDAVVSLCRAHWEVLHRPTGVLLANPIPDEFALDPAEVDAIVSAADDPVAAPRMPPAPAQRTPLLLAAVQDATGGRALDANIALLAANASLAARVAVGLGSD